MFITFNIFRFLAIIVRNYYDLHVYNFFRYVQTAVQSWVYIDITNLRVWSKIGAAMENKMDSKNYLEEKSK